MKKIVFFLDILFRTCIVLVLLAILVFIVDYAYFSSLDSLLFPLFNWFDGISIIWEVFLFGLVAAILAFAFTVLGSVAGFIGRGIGKISSQHSINGIISFLVGLANIVLCIIPTWQSFRFNSLWHIMEFLILAIAIVVINRPLFIIYDAA